MTILAAQLAMCARFGVQHASALPNTTLGVAQDALAGRLPLNGLRHPQQGDANGWFIWAGEELSQEHDYFAPMHAGHLGVLCPSVVPYLGLPPGWRFLIAPDHEDVWFDEALLRV